jgi:hypothetical protein
MDNINMNLGELGWGGVEMIGVASDREKWRGLVSMVINFWVP